MAAASLSRDEIAFGRAVLLATDTLGMFVEGAFWLYDADVEKWRYVLVTSLFRRMGPRKTFLRLDCALREILSDHEIKEFEFLIADPDENIVEPIRRALKTTAHASVPQEITGKFNGSQIAAMVYRMATRLSDQKAKSVQRRFVRRYNELVVPA